LNGDLFHRCFTLLSQALSALPDLKRGNHGDVTDISTLTALRLYAQPISHRDQLQIPIDEMKGGVAMLKALGGPYASQGVRFCPTGGVNLENMNDYLSLPIVNNIGGSWLATQQQIEDKQWSVITEQVMEAMSKVVVIYP
jgi:2-dehydro-3-deoxyphosphogluconate aldolase/(4S)-4-hydroxy-2-oxoglutarate aldolase